MIHILFETIKKRRIFVICSHVTDAKASPNKERQVQRMNITKENTVYCDALKIELATTDTSTGYKPSDCMYMKPVAAYLLAIIKSPDIKIQNVIGKILKGHNIFDYTYFDKELDTDHLYKAIAYTSLYKASGFEDNCIKADDVTIAIVSRDIPQQLFDSLRESDITVEKSGKGIYQIKNMMPLGIQVIVHHEMEETEQTWLKSLINYIQDDFLPRLMLLGLDKCSKMFI